MGSVCELNIYFQIAIQSKRFEDVLRSRVFAMFAGHRSYIVIKHHSWCLLYVDVFLYQRNAASSALADWRFEWGFSLVGLIVIAYIDELIDIFSGEFAVKVIILKWIRCRPAVGREWSIAWAITTVFWSKFFCRRLKDPLSFIFTSLFN